MHVCACVHYMYRQSTNKTDAGLTEATHFDNKPLGGGGGGEGAGN